MMHQTQYNELTDAQRRFQGEELHSVELKIAHS